MSLLAKLRALNEELPADTYAELWLQTRELRALRADPTWLEWASVAKGFYPRDRAHQAGRIGNIRLFEYR